MDPGPCDPPEPETPVGRRHPRTSKGRFTPALVLELGANGANGAQSVAEPDTPGRQQRPGQPLDHGLAATLPAPPAHPAGPRDPPADGHEAAPSSPLDASLPDLRRTPPIPVVPRPHHGPAGGLSASHQTAAGRHRGAAGR